jgi:protein involved in temperature-dependent protein secretion
MLDRGAAQAAVPILAASVRQRPTDAAARYALGSALAQTGNTALALRQLDYAIRLQEAYLAALVRDPALDAFTQRPEVYRFVTHHARRFRERVQRGYA